jgi:hypothetical protein
MISFKQMVFATSLITLTACGQELTDGGYQGEPRHVLQGNIEGLTPSETEGESYVTVVWATWGGEEDTWGSQTAAVSDARFPAEFTLALYDTPPQYALNEFVTPEGASFILGTGYIMVIQDGDGDGELILSEDPGAPDVPLGMAPGHIMIYVPVVDQHVIDTLTYEGSFLINPEALQPGYNLARTVCTGPDEIFDKLEIVPAENIGVVAIDSTELEDACLDFT